MAEEKKDNQEQQSKKGKKLGKSKVQKTLNMVKKVLKEGTQEHIDAIDKVIQAFEDYKNIAALEQTIASMNERLEVAKTTQANEEERQRKKAEEEAKKKAEEEAKSK